MTKRVLVDLAGKKLGMLRVVGRAANRGHRAVWCCVCDCGASLDVLAGNLLSGKSRSCGCVRRRHGKWKVPEYGVWRAIMQRCENPKSPAFRNYGGRGVGVCPAWRDFAVFYGDMGSRPSPLHSIERVDNDKGYEPSNCVWATQVGQGRNRRTSKMTRELALAIREMVATQDEIAARFAVSQSTVSRVKTRALWPEL